MGCTLVLSCLPKSRTFKGEAEGTGKESKKQAEFQAAEKALAALGPQLKPLEAQQAAKREAKREANRLWFEERKAAKKGGSRWCTGEDGVEDEKGKENLV